MTERNITQEEIESLWERSIAPGMSIEMTIKPPSDEAEPTPSAAEPVDLSSSLTVADRIEVREQTIADAGKVKPPPQYELLDVLGEGGMGTVFRARQTSVDRQIALKMLRPESAEKRRDRDRFLSEAVATADLDHPNIIPVYDLGANESGQFFYAMKEVHGTPWEEVLDGKPLQENLSILLRVADAVAFAHSRGIIHRDLKPDNVMLGDYGEVMLTDWGLAVSVTPGGKASKLEDEHAVGGTPSYMAPELAAGEVARIGPCSDVYLLGAILFRIVTGRSPHSGDGVMECLRNAANNVIEVPEEAAGRTREQELLDIARKAMATEPGERHGDVKTFQTQVRAYLDHAESIALAEHAAADLEKAQQSRDYQDYTEALSGYGQALKLWADNERARTGLKDAQLIYASCAFERGDFDLADSLLDGGVPAHRALAKRIDAARRERDAHVKRVRTFKTVAAASAAAVLVLGVGAFIWVQRAELNAVQAEKRAMELEQQRLAAWLPVCEFDFAKENELDERFEIVRCIDPGEPERVVVPDPDAGFLAKEGLLLHGRTDKGGGLAIMRWKEVVAEDIRVEAEIRHEHFFILNICGDALNGYRAVFDTRRGVARPAVELDTLAGGGQVIFARSELPVDYEINVHTAVVEKVGQVIRVELDGVRHIEYFDPVPLSGPENRTFAVSAWYAPVVLRSVKVWKRRSPEVVSVLEVGRNLIRRNHLKDAEDFFRESIRTHARSLVGIEAGFLLGVALQYQGRIDDALTVFDNAADEAGRIAVAGQGASDEKILGTRLQLAAVGQAARMLAEAGDFDKTCDRALHAYRLDATTPIVDMVFNLLMHRLREADFPGGVQPDGSRSGLLPKQERTKRLAALAALPVKTWELSMWPLGDLSGLEGGKMTALRCTNCSLTNLAALAGMRLTRLNCSQNQIRDISPLKEMPLEMLQISGNPIEDLSPLAGMPLKQLDCDGNDLSDLSGLEGLPLEGLDCKYNHITNLSALAGMPLTRLNCYDNRIEDLSPLRTTRLTSLFCERNRIKDLSPLADLPLQNLECHVNQITDLSPLANLPLRYLQCAENQIIDLSPLASVPLEGLGCEFNRIADLSPLAGLDLTWFECVGNRITDLSPLKGMPLKGLNCTRNNIVDLSPLADSPLERLDATSNRIRDLSPLAGLPLVALNFSSNGISSLSPLKGMQLNRLSCEWNMISSLAPLKGMPLDRLACGRNRITDLAPLAGMPLRWLGMNGIPFAPANVDVLASLELESLTFDLTTAGGIAAVERIASLVSVNGHTRKHFLAVARDVSRALRGENVDLRKHAFEGAGFQWLAVPQQMTRDEAIQFCEEQDGYLACLSTKEKDDLLVEYVNACVASDGTGSHFGIKFDPASGHWGWLSGEPYVDGVPGIHTVPGGPRQDEPLVLFPTGDGLWYERGHLPANFIIEWKVGE